MHNGWPINWAILPILEKRKETGHIDTSKKKIARKFNENWTKERKWLKYDNEKQLMYCIKFVTSGKHRGNYPISFIKGCANFKTSALNDHESSKQHIDAVAHFKAIETPEKTVAKQTLIFLNEHKRHQLENHFRNVHALVKNNRPVRDIIWLTELDKAKNIDVGETYSNRKSATTLMEYISEA